MAPRLHGAMPHKGPKDGDAAVGGRHGPILASNPLVDEPVPDVRNLARGQTPSCARQCSLDRVSREQAVRSVGMAGDPAKEDLEQPPELPEPGVEAEEFTQEPIRGRRVDLPKGHGGNKVTGRLPRRVLRIGWVPSLSSAPGQVDGCREMGGHDGVVKHQAARECLRPGSVDLP